MFYSRQSRQFLGYNDKTRQDKTVFSEELESVPGKQKISGCSVLHRPPLALQFQLRLSFTYVVVFSISQTDTRLYSFLARQLKVFIEAIHTVRHRKGFHDGKIH